MSRRVGIFGLGALLLAVACTPEVADDGASNAGTSGAATGGYAGANLAGAGGAETQPGAGSGGAGSTPDAGGGAGPLSQGDAGPDQSGTGGSNSVGAGGSEPDGPDAGSNQGGTGGSDLIEQGGAGGADVGQGGSDVGEGGSNQGGSDQGGSGGSEIIDPEPECEGAFSRCNGNVYEECDAGGYLTYQCSPEIGLNCYPGEGCVGDCYDGDTRCTGDTAEACVHGEWTTAEECPFQCVAGACEGVCTPGTVVCGDGASTVTCGSDFQYGSPVACPTDPNGTASCSDGECDLQPIACGAGTADCDGNWSCESDLSSLSSCGACGNVCPNPANTAPTCSETTGCGFSCDDGFADCDGDPSNGCEQNVATDALNCGACGSRCYGTSCDAGQCEYAFEVVSDYSGENTLVTEVTSSATHIYWLTQTELRRAPKGGGPYEILATIATPSAIRTGLLVESGKVCWLTDTGIYVMPEAGGTPDRITTQTGVRGFAAANGKLYWNNSTIDANTSCLTEHFSDQNAFFLCNATKVTRFRSYDLATETFSGRDATGEYSTPLAAAGNELIVAEYGGTFPGHAEYEIRLNVYDATTGGFLRQLGGALRVNNALHNTYQLLGTSITQNRLVYSGNLTGGEANSGLVTAPLAGGDILVTNSLISTERSRELAADETTVYFRDGSKVAALTLEGEPAGTFFESEATTSIQLVVDDAYIYFTAYTNGGEQAILRAPK
jgi:hypothetical protein